MSAMHEDLKKFEDKLLKIRIELRNLKSLASVFAEYDHPAKYERHISANNQTAKALADEIKLALIHLDQFELYRDSYFNQENYYESVMGLMKRNHR